MQAVVKAGIAVMLLLGLSDCSTAGSLFSYDGASARSAHAAEQDSDPGNTDCAKVASARADDAVMASYVVEGSSAKQDIYQAAYRDCAAWQSH